MTFAVLASAHAYRSHWKVSLKQMGRDDRTGGFVGADVNGRKVAGNPVSARRFGNYAQYVMTFQTSAGDTIRVWMYSPTTPGYVVIDDVSLTHPSRRGSAAVCGLARSRHDSRA
jgi:hypothetical protein